MESGIEKIASHEFFVRENITSHGPSFGRAMRDL
jgi:hypothetical protein